jgi:carboxymethylenebutenolidase
MVQPYSEEGVQEANRIAASVTAENLIADVSGAIAWLNSQPFVKSGKIATWGFDFGANAAFVTAGLRELSGAIMFYPTQVMVAMPSGGEPPIDHVQDIAIPLLIIFGEQDYYVPRYDMDRMCQTIKDAKKDVRMEIYPGVGHSFFRHGRPQAILELQRYSDEAVAQAVADAWGMVKAFLIDIFNRPRSRAAETGDIRTERTQSIRA